MIYLTSLSDGFNDMASIFSSMCVAVFFCFVAMLSLLARSRLYILVEVHTSFFCHACRLPVCGREDIEDYHIWRYFAEREPISTTAKLGSDLSVNKKTTDNFVGSKYNMSTTPR